MVVFFNHQPHFFSCRSTFILPLILPLSSEWDSRYFFLFFLLCISLFILPVFHSGVYILWGFNHTHTHNLFSVVNCFRSLSLYLSSNLLSLYISKMTEHAWCGSLLCPSVSRGKTQSPSLFCFHCVASVLLPVTVREMFACVQKHFV